MRAHRVVSCTLTLLALGSAGLALHLGGRERPLAVVGTARRIVANSPALVEIIFAVGAGGQVVGRSHFATFPPEALRIPDVGGALDPNLQAMESLRPDAILLQMKGESTDAFAASRGIAVEHFQIETIEETLEAIARCGKITGHEHEAAFEIDRLRRAIDARRARAPRARPTVLVSAERQAGELRQLGALGRGTFVMECVEIAGGAPAIAKMRGYSVISKEAILDARPEVVIELRTEPASRALEDALIRDWELAFPTLPAVANRRVRVVQHPAALTPGPRLDELIELLARAIESGP